MAKSKQPANPWPDVLRAFRERMGWSQTRAAEECSTTLRSWSRWETTDKPPAGMVAALLKCKLEKYTPDLLKKLP